MKDNKLEVGDEVYNESSGRWNRETYFKVSKVVRLTKTQAILDNGDKLINAFALKGSKGFSLYGDIYNKYNVLTEEISLKIKAQRLNRKIENWFDSYKFSKQEKEMVYNLINKKQ